MNIEGASCVGTLVTQFGIILVDGGSQVKIPGGFAPEAAQSESGSSKWLAYIMSRCSSRMGSSAASVSASLAWNTALVPASIAQWAGGSGSNMAAKAAL